MLLHALVKETKFRLDDKYKIAICLIQNQDSKSWGGVRDKTTYDFCSLGRNGVHP